MGIEPYQVFAYALPHLSTGLFALGCGQPHQVFASALPLLSTGLSLGCGQHPVHHACLLGCGQPHQVFAYALPLDLRRVFCGVMAQQQQQDKLWKKCYDGRLEEVREELEGGADPNTTQYQNSLLMVAAGRNQYEVVALLLASPGIQVNAKYVENRTALHSACFNGSLASLRKLMATDGLQLNETDNWGRTPIMTAIIGEKTEAVRLMTANAGVCLDARDNQGRSLEELALKE